jgi:hypothetical protein
MSATYIRNSKTAQCSLARVSVVRILMARNIDKVKMSNFEDTGNTYD